MACPIQLRRGTGGGEHGMQVWGRVGEPGMMSSMCQLPGLFGVPGMPCDWVCGCMWIPVQKGSMFPDRSIPGPLNKYSHTVLVHVQ